MLYTLLGWEAYKSQLQREAIEYPDTFGTVWIHTALDQRTSIYEMQNGCRKRERARARAREKEREREREEFFLTYRHRWRFRSGAVIVRTCVLYLFVGFV